MRKNYLKSLLFIKFDKDDETTYPKDNEDKLVGIVYGENGIINFDVIVSSFRNGKWSNCDMGEIVYAWAEKPTLSNIFFDKNEEEMKEKEDEIEEEELWN